MIWFTTSQVLVEQSGSYDGGAGPPWPWGHNGAAHLKVDKEEGGPEPEACQLLEAISSNLLLLAKPNFLKIL